MLSYKSKMESLMKAVRKLSIYFTYRRMIDKKGASKLGSVITKMQ